MSYTLFLRVHFVAVITFFITLLAEVSFLICAAPAILTSLPGWGLVIYTLIPYPIGVELHGVMHLLITGGAILVIILSFSWVMLRPGEGFIHILASKKRDLWGMGEMESIGMALMGALCVNFFIYLIAEISQAKPVTPEFPENTLQVVELLFFASFWEELVVKLSFISLPLLVLGVIFRWQIPWWRYLTGGRIELKGVTFIFMLFSAMIFGILHVIGGWDWWKFFPAFIAGVLSAALFLRFGLHASILFHFANNFLSAPSLLANNLIVDYIVTGILLYFVGMGTIYWVLLFRSLFRTENKPKEKDLHPSTHQENPSSPPTHLHVVTSSASPYLCSACRNDEFMFSEGVFICTRCGQKVGQPPESKQDEKKDVMEI